MVADTHISGTHTTRAQKKRKRLSTHSHPHSLPFHPTPSLSSSSSSCTTQQRQHAHQPPLTNRTLTINTKRPLDFIHPANLESRCPDWILLATNGGVHYARNKAWFDSATYTPLNFLLDNGMWCQGVGKEVRVDVRIGGGGGGGGCGFGTVVLEHVLHVPKAPCNGFSLALCPDYERVGAGLRDGRSGDVLQLAKIRGLDRLDVLGGSSGESPLEDLGEDGVSGRLLDLAVRLSDGDVRRIRAVVAPEGP